MTYKIIESENPPRLSILINDEGFILDHSLTDNFLVRTAILEMLRKAKSLLPPNLTLKIGELYRTAEKQKKMWHEVYDRLQRENPTFTESQLTEKTEIWIANPYKEGSGHQTGAAADVTIVEIDSNGKELCELDMGTKMQEFNEKTVTACYLLSREQSRNRELLLKIMSEAGFTNYPDEWWHFSYGERLWASLTGATETIYAALSDNVLAEYRDRRLVA